MAGMCGGVAETMCLCYPSISGHGYNHNNPEPGIFV